ncbi:GyrI-like domain-containing protein [Paenibacillus spongiae]|uniref:GyrI-like domain-containing protein n=1 Tax=Paenibacillus spongiae TaxID=2909671 RepID=A0ABY5S4P8_9BACL|nr:GyrI-like domain-containing protein [Paenibacillus spongiae]UVI27540.1 GyrI-like domain-containing protein [Paenibacillus spongiae]
MIQPLRGTYEDGNEAEAGSCPESYRPSRVPGAFKLLRGMPQDDKMEAGTMNDGPGTITVVERPEMNAIVLKTIRNGRDVREAWREIEQVMTDHPDRLHKDQGLVFIPEWQWTTSIETLWVGVEVASLEHIPQGFETMSIPARKFARTTVRGDRTRMDHTYDALWKWFDTEGYKRDMTESSYGYELNRLSPVNPFHIPADKINDFDFDIYAPILSN